MLCSARAPAFVPSSCTPGCAYLYMSTKSKTILSRQSREKNTVRIVGDELNVKIASEPCTKRTENLIKSQYLASPLYAGTSNEEYEDPKNKNVLQARTLLVIASALYGTNFASVKIIEEYLDPSIAAALRFGLAALVLSPFLKGSTSKTFKNGAEVGIWVALGYFAQSIALMTTTASKSAFICSLAVIFVPILDSIFARDSKADANNSVSKWTAALLAVGGVACLELGGLEHPVIGDLWALVQPICFGMGFWRMEKHARSNPNSANQLTAAQLLIVAVMSFMWAIQSNTDFSAVIPILRSHTEVIIGLLWTGIITTALTVGMETIALKDLSAAESTVILSSEPVWGSAFAVMVLGEHAGLNTVAGALLILCACLWGTLQEKYLKSAATAGGLVGVAGLIENAAENVEKFVEGIVALLNSLFFMEL